MSKYLKVKEQKTFKVPLQSEVSDFIKLKKNWPQKFCEYYAERFWNFYESNGWKVSGRALMKSWESAFYAQWQTLKFKEDIDFMNRCIVTDPTIPADKKGSSYMNTCLAEHVKHWDKIIDENYAKVYDYMKDHSLIKMTGEEKQKAIRYADGNVIKGKALCVKIIFDRMVTHNEVF